MTPENLILIGVALVAVAAAVAAFAIAWRRSTGSDWRGKVSAETRQADRSRGLDLPPVPVAAEEEPVVVEAETEEVEAAESSPVAVAVATERRLVEATPEEAGVTRRQFFNRALGSVFGAFSAMLGLSFLAFLWPKISGGFGSDVNAGSVAALLEQAINDDGSITPVFIPEARAYVVPAPATLSEAYEGKGVEAGGLMALFQRCVHLGCRVPWCGPSQGFECPCHGSKYNSIGEYNAGPAPRNLDRFTVELNPSNELIIQTGTIIQTPRALEPSVEYPQGPSCIGAG
ncbi:MAG: ubiquinol-cytochrome c reductase iron-sulfur subunit [Acidimicrobiia bacterium]|nr:ubiquinol-cytochrome c reductase iron-sulfur subunit [Acidimicrobiia bacterium]